MEHQFFTDQLVSQKDFTAITFAKGDYESCTFKNCNFANVNLSHVKFIDCEFEACNLSSANIYDTGFQDVQFLECKMLGLLFDKADTFGFSITVKDCQLNHASFYKVNLNSSSFEGCNFQQADFSEATLKGITLTTCNFQQAVFDGTNLEQANLKGSKNYRINPEKNQITKAKFNYPDVLGILEHYQIIVEE
jgi:uncharacterized protein YjbI with pentapeptide repeats